VVEHPAVARQLSGSASFSESRSGKIGHISFGVKQTRKPSAGNLHAGFDAAGTGNQFTVWLLRHSQRKRRETARPNLRSMAPVLDPTCSGIRSQTSLNEAAGSARDWGRKASARIESRSLTQRCSASTGKCTRCLPEAFQLEAATSAGDLFAPRWPNRARPIVGKLVGSTCIAGLVYVGYRMLSDPCFYYRLLT
jgi:hypothetical protein